MVASRPLALPASRPLRRHTGARRPGRRVSQRPSVHARIPAHGAQRPVQGGATRARARVRRLRLHRPGALEARAKNAPPSGACAAGGPRPAGAPADQMQND